MRIPFIVAVLVLLTASAHAQGWYVAVHGGMTMPADADVTAAGVSGSATVAYDPAPSLALALGHDFTHTRLEIAVDYAKTDVDTVTAGTATGTGSDVRRLALMLNGYYDFLPMADWTPFVGAGVGLAQLHAGTIQPPGGFPLMDEEDTVAAYQASVGISWFLHEKLQLELAYRYHLTSNPKWNGASGEYAAHAVSTGLRLYL